MKDGTGSSGTNRGAKSGRQLSDEDLLADFDTVSGQAGDTVASSRSKVGEAQNLSTSDSGRLVPIVPRAKLPDQSSGGSTIDLEVESGFKMPRRGDSGKGKAEARNKAASRSSGGSGVSRGSGRLVRGDEGVRRAKAIDKARQQGATKPVPPQISGKGVTLWLVVGLAVMFVVAVALGFVLARLTS